MKRLRRVGRVALIFVWIVAALVFTAGCGKPDYSGIYRLSRLQYVENGEIVTVNTGDLIDGKVLEENFAVLELKEDGTAVLTLTDLVEDVSHGSWKALSGGKAQIFIGGMTQTVEMKWDGFVFQVGEWTVTFTLQDSYYGVYKLVRLQYVFGGAVITVNAGESFQGKTLKEDFMIIELKEDGTMKMTITDLVTDTTYGTWEADGESSDIVRLYFAGSVQTVRMERNAFVLSVDEWTITFHKE